MRRSRRCALPRCDGGFAITIQSPYLQKNLPACSIYTTMAYAPCIFCGRTDSKPHHKEDVLPKWIARQFPKRAIWEIQKVSPKTDRSYNARGHLGLVTRAPCRRCNNGWMSRLEDTAQPILIPLMNGERMELSESQQYIVARWLIKTAMVHEFLTEENIIFFQQDERESFMETSIIPLKYHISLAAYYGTQRICTRESHFRLDDIIRPSPNNTASLTCYSATFAIKQLAMQIFSFRCSEKFPVDWIFLRPGATWEKPTDQIFPYRGIVEWPQPYYLDDEMFEHFAERWNPPNPV